MYKVYGTTTSREKMQLLKDAGIDLFLISLSASRIEGKIQEFLSQVEVLIINIPPRLRGGNQKSFYDKMLLLNQAIQQTSVSKILFISSTAVYGDVHGNVTEATQPNPVSESGRQLLKAEKLFRDSHPQTTVIRFGGLIGPNRNPATILSGRANLRNGSDPINLIHLEDCIHMITMVLENGYWGELFNGVYPYHPAKREFYTEQAQKLGIPIPHYQDDNNESQGKIVISKNFLDKPHGFNTSIDI